jgi:hypothetical protein
VNFCRDCNHFKPYRVNGFVIDHLCAACEFKPSSIDPVTGVQIKATLQRCAYIRRAHPDECPKFKTKPPELPRKGLLAQLLEWWAR